MTEIVIAVAGNVVGKIAEYLVAPITLPFSYLWNYKSNVENLKKRVKMLEGRRDSVQCLVEAAGRNGRETLQHIKNWQESVNQIIPEALELINEHNPEQANIQCCKGFSCPNVKNRYQFSKKAADKLKDVVGLEQEAAGFKEVSYPTIPEQTLLQPSKGHEAFESRKSILKDIIDALLDPNVNMVGIYGMGGVGKTTLAKEVASEAKQHKLFDKIVFVEVSESPDIKIIQGVVADNLGLHFNEESVPELFSSAMGVTEEAREEDMRDTVILFPKLNRLKIENLEKLITLWPGYYIEFPSLKELTIQICPELEAFIFDEKVRVPSLEEMEISDMDNLKMIWHNELDGDSFHKLKSLEVDGCQKLMTVLPLNIRGRLLSLESLIVRSCGSLEGIFDLQGIISEERNSIAATQSRELCFSNLQELEVTDCQSLKYLFAASNVANDDYSPKFLFPKLTSMELSRLPELRSFHPGRHKVEGPVLIRLELCDCGIHDTDEDGQMQMQQLLFFVEQGQVPESLFDILKTLEVEDDDSTVLNIWDCNSLINVMPPSASFQNLTVMEVESCSSLINIGTSSAAKSLVQLTQMRILECENIIEVIGNHGGCNRG
ncbi:hypothetical protein Dsin_023646 [Dipteronia sinensis]|uniref:NB-ARC domain-containing protein n=1 Tax=Dipteronia sinensis TaxID=43782 RepID=A0AAE0E135_9ROSI|nr:hypothetical protein Dsin_023646 [Dipteronia sinensis]